MINEATIKAIASGIVKGIEINKLENIAKNAKDNTKAIDKNGNVLKGCFAMKLKVYPYIQETLKLTPEQSYKLVEEIAEKTGAFKVGKSRFGAIFYLPSDFQEFKKADKKAKTSFADFMAVK